MLGKNIKLKVFAVAILLGLLAVSTPSSVFADTYTIGSAATLGPITSQTEATTPATRSRTTIGIAEKVTCTRGTWQDCDYNVTQEMDEADSIGTRTWSKSGTQAANSSLSSTTGDSTTLTASKSPGAVTVKIAVLDSQSRGAGNDAVDEETRAFTIIAPSSSFVYVVTSNSPVWTAWTSGDKHLAARSLYTLTLSPGTVSFYRASIRENFGSATTDTWPDTSTWTGPAGTVGPVTPTQENKMADEQVTGMTPYNSNKLYTGAEWQNFSTGFDVPLEYQNADGTWINFATPYASRSYYHNTRHARVTVGAVAGSAQGPWQAAP